MQNLVESNGFNIGLYSFNFLEVPTKVPVVPKPATK
jgi:hypothetical protein